MKLYLATGNKGKVGELIPLVEEFFPLFTEIVAQAPKDADETEDTFVGNARIKAHALARELLAEGLAMPFAILSDDSGLEVASLDGKPGVHSARYAADSPGEHASSEKNIEKLLVQMATKDERTCRYVCCLYLHIQESSQKTTEHFAEGYCPGEIMQDAKGSGGFGYDPVFWVPELNKRMSEATLVEKNSLSHRRRAFEALLLSGA